MRTTRQFQTKADLWVIADTWSQEQRFTLVQSRPNYRLYQRGSHWLDYPVMVELERTGEHVSLGTWVAAGVIARARTLFLVPSEVAIDAPGPRLLLARRSARNAVNNFLARLNQPLLS